MSNREKAVYGLVLLTAWGAFAWFGKTEVSGFISAITSVLTGLGLYHFTRSSAPPSQLVPPSVQSIVPGLASFEVEAPSPPASPVPAAPPASPPTA